MRIKVIININNVLLREKLIKLGHETKWREFGYENLSYVCYYFGILGINKKTCISRKKDVHSGNLKIINFSAWMRVKNHLFINEHSKWQERNEALDSSKQHHIIKPKMYRDEGNSKSLHQLMEETRSSGMVFLRETKNQESMM